MRCSAPGADVDAADQYSVTPLVLACTNANARLVTRLLEAGADPRAAQATGETPLMTCARSGIVAAVMALLATGADVNGAERFHGQTALMWAAWEGHDAVVRTLLAHGAEVDARTTTGYTALLLAAREAYADVTRTLLAAGADVNAAAHDGTTALLVAVIRRHLDYAELLLEHGADPNLGPGFTPLHWAAGKWDTELNDLSNGVAEGNRWSVVRRPPRGRSAAHGAAAPRPRRRPRPADGPHARVRHPGQGPPGEHAGRDRVPHRGQGERRRRHARAARSRRGSVPADLQRDDAPDGGGRRRARARHHALDGGGGAPGGDGSSVELGADVNAVNEAGDTALHGAAWRERADSIVQFLVDRGAAIDAKNYRDWTPLVIAEGIHTGGNFIKSDTTAALLRSLGAAPSPPDVVREPAAAP